MPAGGADVNHRPADRVVPMFIIGRPTGNVGTTVTNYDLSMSGNLRLSAASFGRSLITTYG